MTSAAKRKVSITLDADLVAALEADGSTTLSAEVNSALRAEFTRRKRQQALADLLPSSPCRLAVPRVFAPSRETMNGDAATQTVLYKKCCSYGVDLI